ncbi:hypothetical protein [Streptomyces platensis]|uniref:hypothetical protein n=1 Tax=Streptomyces platensis TaxID=58346 RepID=UPI002E2669BB
MALDYSMAREDERTFFNVQVAVTGVAVALLAGIATLVSVTCQLNYHPGCTRPPNIFLAGAPAIPLAVLAMLQTLGASSAMRTYYMRALEKEIRGYARAPLEQLSPVANIGPASYAGLVAEVTTLRRGRSGYRFLAVLIMLIAFFTFGGLTIYTAFSLPGAYRVGMLLGYGISFAILFANVASVTLGARQTFIRIAKRFSARQHSSMFEGSPTSEGGRGLMSYLLFPRPEDWIKWLFIPLVFVLVSWGRGNGYRWASMVTALLITEYLVYSARYQWNDIRGLRDDLNHPQTSARFRLPRIDSPRRARFVVGSSLLAAFLRLLAALVLGVVLHRLPFVLSLISTVFGVAVIYEFLRRVEAHSDAAARTLWVSVGVGYAVRFLVGVYAAGEPLLSTLTLSGVAYAYAFGIMFVLMTWALEGTAFCVSKKDNEWRIADNALTKKRHIMLLLPHFRTPRIDITRPMSGLPPSLIACGEIPVLAEPDKVKTLFSPWRVSFICAALCSGPLGMLLAQQQIDIRVALGSALLAGFSAVAVVRIPAMMAFMVVTGVSFTLVGMSYLAGFSEPRAELLIVAFPWFLNGAVYLSFTQQSYDQLKNFAPNSLKRIKSWRLQVVKWIVGKDTWTEIN